MAGVTVRPHPTANKVIDTEVDIIQAAFAPLTLGVPGSFGLQDDAAFVPSPQTGLIVTQDQVIEGTHFLTSDPIDMVARRLVRRNLSDLIAKGGVPHAAFLSLAWPKSRPLSEILIFAEGLGDDLSQLCSHCPLLGGDTSLIEGPMVASLTMMGKPTTPSGQPVLRSGAQIGDILCVSGTIGDAWLGLQVRLGAIPVAGLEACVRVAMAPAPPKHELARLVGAYATASVDVSDGLLRDAGHIASMSGVRL
jgi:thiamine-monophosphate kinase